MKLTRQRAAVLAALAGHEGFVGAQHLHEDILGGGDSVGLATVYRSLTALVDAGEVDAIRGLDGETLYRACARREHHHHLVCTGCGKTVEIDGPTVEAWASAVASDHGFTDIGHTVELWGTCSRCQ